MKKILLLLILMTVTFVSYSQTKNWDDEKTYYFKLQLENKSIVYLKRTLPKIKNM